MPIIIQMDSVSKVYHRGRGHPAVHAVICLCLSVPAGQVLGLLGHPGAGKTTVLKLIGGLAEPTAGQVLVNGYDVTRQREAARRQILAALDGVAYVHNRTVPAQPILLLDEQVPGDDVQAAQGWLKALAHEHGKTVVLATHDLDVARRLCDRVAILSHGRLVAERDAYFLADRFLECPFYHIRVRGYLSEPWAAWFDGLALTTEDNGEMVLSGPIIDQAALHGVLAKLRNMGLPLLSVTRNDLNLGELFAGTADRQQKRRIDER